MSVKGDKRIERDLSVGRNVVVEGTLTNFLVATGAIDDSNVEFEFDFKPSLIIINSAIYPEGSGVYNWSWNSGIVTLAIPVGVGGFIVGLR